MPADDHPVFSETTGGQYTDEATGETVNPRASGLMTVFTVSELRNIIENKQVLALTPETTLMAKLTKTKLDSGKAASEATAAAKATVQEQLIVGTNPAIGVPGDSLFLIGDLSAELPADQAEALARNLAISFSYEADALNIEPVKVFDLLDTQARDLEDGKLDGKDRDARLLAFTDRDGNEHDLSQRDQKTEYGQAHSRLLSHTIDHIGSGDIPVAEKDRLEKLGVETGYFDQLHADNEPTKADTEGIARSNRPARR
ncbi:MAG: hypothetical protein ACWA5X_03160 [bacterium]